MRHFFPCIAAILATAGQNAFAGASQCSPADMTLMPASIGVSTNWNLQRIYLTAQFPATETIVSCNIESRDGTDTLQFQLNPESPAKATISTKAPLTSPFSVTGTLRREFAVKSFEIHTNENPGHRNQFPFILRLMDERTRTRFDVYLGTDGAAGRVVALP